MTFFKTLLMLTILTASITGRVEHAPTLAQCQADQRLWFSKMEEQSATSSSLPPYDILTQWQSEMLDCGKVDPPNRGTYYFTAKEAGAEQSMRMMDFITRHGMWDKFMAEDAAGKR